MKYSTEAQLMQALGIESWRNLSKANTIRFAAMMPDIDKDLALKIVEQFPEFKKFALETLDVMERRHESTLNQNAGSQDAVHQAFRETREILKGELQNEDLDWEQRKYLLKMILETSNREFEKDTENKKFLDSLFSKVAVAGLATLAMGIVFVGGKAAIESGELDDLVN
jgi:tyrosyl-tRNA synthetase